jgi:hypothetical protein
MKHHVINVSFLIGPNGDEAVIAEPTPLPQQMPNQPQIEVSPGDTVTWRFDPSRELHVIFKQRVEPLPPNPSPPFNASLLKASGPLGPFSSLSTGAGVIVGTVNSGVSTNIANAQRFICDLVDAATGKTMPWAALEGGVDVPRTPP